MLIISFLTLYLAYSKAFTTKAEIQEQYREEILKENAIIPKKDKILFQDMLKWFEKNTKTKDKFVEWRSNEK
jgi:hypothetical protein